MKVIKVSIIGWCTALACGGRLRLVTWSVPGGVESYRAVICDRCDP